MKKLSIKFLYMQFKNNHFWQNLLRQILHLQWEKSLTAFIAFFVIINDCLEMLCIAHVSVDTDTSVVIFIWLLWYNALSV